MSSKVERSEARTAIVAAANKHRRARLARDVPRGRDGYVFAPKPFSARSLQLAVCVARRNRLVHPDVLVAAGFRPKETR